MSEKITINPNNSYHKRYRVREIGGAFSISIPKEMVERKMREEGLDPDNEADFEEFRKKYRVLMMFDSFGELDGAFKFVEVEKDERERE